MGLDQVVRVLAVVAAFGLVSGCRDPDVVNTPGRPISGPLSGPVGLDTPNPTEEWPPPSMGADTEVCPSEANEPSYDEVVALGKADEQGALRDDVRILSDYGVAHPETFGSVRYGWNTAGDSLMIIALTGDLDGPRGVLNSMVAHPEALVVCRAALTEGALHAMRAEIETRLAGRYAAFGEGAGTLMLELHPGDEAIAAELHAQYGDVLDIQVGAMPYPLPEGGAPVQGCGTVPEPPADQVGLAITLDPLTADPRIAGGTTTLVRIVNQSSAVVSFGSGQPLTAVLVRPGTSEIVGVYTGGIRRHRVRSGAAAGGGNEYPGAGQRGIM
jgi:hypothetical protein